MAWNTLVGVNLNLVPIGRDRFGQQRGDRDLWPDGILSPLITDFRLHCAESRR